MGKAPGNFLGTDSCRFSDFSGLFHRGKARLGTLFINQGNDLKDVCTGFIAFLGQVIIRIRKSFSRQAAAWFSDAGAWFYFLWETRIGRILPKPASRRA